MDLETFRELLKTQDDQVKPVMIFSVDGGPDENPRYQKTIAFAIEHFKSYDLDALFVATNAPGRSAYNRVERRMAPLSKQLSGLILEHDHFGNHLDSSGRTTDPNLELKNFQYAGELLAQIWSEMVIDGYPVHAEYKNSEEKIRQPLVIDAHWYSTHVRESQYLLQITKCTDVHCCGIVRSDIFSLLVDRFLPPPYPLAHTSEGVISIPPPDNMKESLKFASLMVRLALKILPQHEYLQSPYDLYCPSVAADISGRTCRQCGVYFASKNSLSKHLKVHGRAGSTQKIKPKSIADRRPDEVLCVIETETPGFEDVLWLSLEDVDAVDVPEPEDSNNIDPSGAEIIQDFPEWLAGPWSEDN